MSFNLSLEKGQSRLLLILLLMSFCALSGYLVLRQFIVGTLTDGRVRAGRSDLASGAALFSDSPRLLGLLAESELQDLDLEDAERHAGLASDLSPSDYNLKLLLSLIRESKNDTRAAETALEQARILAPSNSKVLWRAANLYLRERRLDRAAMDFQSATRRNPALLAQALELIWQVSDRDPKLLALTAGDEPRARLEAARFLLDHSEADRALEIFSTLEGRSSLPDSEKGVFVDALVAAGRFQQARLAWLDLKNNGTAPLVYNGGFEYPIQENMQQFDWVIGRSRHARIAVDSGVAHSGTCSLRLDFTGHDTTTLNGEVRQQVLLEPGRSYLIEYYAKARDLKTPEGPRIFIEDNRGWQKASAPLAPGTYDWSRFTLELIPPSTASSGPVPLWLSIKRIPRYSYDDPTTGTIWMDDFRISPLDRKGGNGRP